ncbi:Actin-1 [Bulinus truncatus]|nr:Actin-1 [Bulinus truncatus]
MFLFGFLRGRWGVGKDEFFVGSQLQENRELLALKYPIENGIVVDWDDMMKVWDYALYSSLSIKPEEHPILMSEPPFNPRGNREKMAQVLFETYRTPAAFVAYQPMLTKHAIGLSRGLMVSVGDCNVHVVPIIDGYVLYHAIKRLDFGGRNLTTHLQKLIMNQGYSFTTAHELEIVRELKEKFCYIPEKKKSEDTGLNTSCQLSDGSFIELDSRIFKSPEILFQSDGVVHNGKSIVDIIFESVSDADIDNRTDLYNTVCLSGGSTLFPGFAERLKNEMLTVLSNTKPRVKIWAFPKRRLHKWIGGSVLASLSSFSHLWISRQDYDEHGPNIFNIHCYGE